MNAKPMRTYVISTDPANKEAEVVTEPRKGFIFEQCATEGCTRKARWIPISHVSTQPQPFAYYCPECCDAIALDAERARA